MGDGGVERRRDSFNEVLLFFKVFISDTARCVNDKGKVSSLRTLHDCRKGKEVGKSNVIDVCQVSLSVH